MSDSTPRKLYTEADMEEMSHTQAVQILGEDRGHTAKKRIIQHNGGMYPGQVGTIVTGSHKNFHTQEDIPCHVVRYENGDHDYIPMNIPGYQLDKVPFVTRKMGKRHCEMFYEEAEAATYRARLVKGRAVE